MNIKILPFPLGDMAQLRDYQERERTILDLAFFLMLPVEVVGQRFDRFVQSSIYDWKQCAYMIKAGYPDAVAAMKDD